MENNVYLMSRLDLCILLNEFSKLKANKMHLEIDFSSFHPCRVQNLFEDFCFDIDFPCFYIVTSYLGPEKMSNSFSIITYLFLFSIDLL